MHTNTERVNDILFVREQLYYLRVNNNTVHEALSPQGHRIKESKIHDHFKASIFLLFAEFVYFKVVVKHKWLLP